MTREEFLKKLKEALENDLSGRIVQENVSYYESYIIEEIRKGRTESEVIEELGDPWIIARSIIDMAEGEPGTREAYYESAKSSSRQERKWLRPGNRSLMSAAKERSCNGYWFRAVL